jgi:hypothetical protein
MACSTRSNSHTVAACCGCTNIPRPVGGAQEAGTILSVGRPTDDLTAYDFYLRAYAMVLSSARHIPEALRLMEQAIARDPRYGPALRAEPRRRLTAERPHRTLSSVGAPIDPDNTLSVDGAYSFRDGWQG